MDPKYPTIDPNDPDAFDKFFDQVIDEWLEDNPAEEVIRLVRKRERRANRTARHVARRRRWKKTVTTTEQSHEEVQAMTTAMAAMKSAKEKSAEAMKSANEKLTEAMKTANKKNSRGK
jgi:uncharacterized protein (DUF2236 family)